MKQTAGGRGNETSTISTEQEKLTQGEAILVGLEVKATHSPETLSALRAFFAGLDEE